MKRNILHQTIQFTALAILLLPSLEKNGNAQAKFQLVHAFGLGTDGAGVWAGVVFDSQGNIYGTTAGGGGGRYAVGVAYELAPNGNGGWSESILHSFGNSGDGGGPVGEVLVGNDGIFYGTTYTVLHTFNDLDGVLPADNLTFGPDGNLYGTTVGGGPYGGGVVFEISRQ